MGIAVWRVTEKPKKKMAMGSICQIMDKAQVFKKVMISTSGPAAEVPDVTDGCADKSKYERNWGFLKMVVPEARND